MTSWFFGEKKFILDSRHWCIWSWHWVGFVTSVPLKLSTTPFACGWYGVINWLFSWISLPHHLACRNPPPWLIHEFRKKILYSGVKFRVPTYTQIDLYTSIYGRFYPLLGGVKFQRLIFPRFCLTDVTFTITLITLAPTCQILEKLVTKVWNLQRWIESMWQSCDDSIRITGIRYSLLTLQCNAW
jgi:hypothetical protein